MEHLIEDVDFSTYLPKLEELSALMACSKCNHVPSKAEVETASASAPTRSCRGLFTLLNVCGHSLCSSCAPGSKAIGPCPVQGCQVSNEASDVDTDRARLERWQAFYQMKAALSSLCISSSSALMPKANDKAPKKPRAAPRKTKGSPSMPLHHPRDNKRPKNKAGSKARSKANEDPKAVTRSDSPCSNPRTKSQKLKDVNKKNSKGETKLHSACIKGQTEMVRRLLNEGASPNTQDFAGWTPLHEAAQKGHTDIVDLLLTNGAVPNVPGAENSTPLHDAVSAGHQQIVVMLIQHGAKKDAINSEGKTPWDLALSESMKSAIQSTESLESESQLLELSMAAESVVLPVLFLANLSGDAVTQARNMAKSLGWKVEAKLTDEVTHVLFDCKQDKKVVESVAYIKGLLMGKWLLSSEWILQTRESDLPDEKAFVLHGIKDCHLDEAPLNSRINSLQHLPRLFDGFNIFLKGSFDAKATFPDKTSLSNLLKVGGATVLSREPDPEMIPDSEKKIPYHARRDGPLAKCSHVILYQAGGKQPMLKYNMNHLKSLPIDWIFRCIHSFAIVDPLKEWFEA